MIITTNRSFEEWGMLFGDKAIESAVIDRIIHHASIMKVIGKSYRVRDVISLRGSVDIDASSKAET